MNLNRLKIAAAKPLFREEDLEYIQTSVSQVLASGRLILGEYTKQFEDDFKAYVGTGHAVAVNSCTAAIQIVLRHFNVSGREVLLPTNNFIGVVSAVIQEGGIPVLVDMDPETFCIDTDDLERRITPKTAGIITVDIAGLVCPDMERIRDISKAHGLFCLEDASHAHGAELNGEKAGGLADAGCFSFYPTKIITTGVGGMLATNNSDLAEYARSVRHHGVGKSLENIVHFGNDWCMGEIQAIMGIAQLGRLEENLAHRNRMIRCYREKLQHIPWLKIPVYKHDHRHAYYKFPTLLETRCDRDAFRRMLYAEYAIENGTVYDPPCHLQPVMQDLGYHEGMYPVAESVLKRQFCPPIHSALTGAEVDQVVFAIQESGERLGFNG
jgi:dTDP-4-amino-4,6-dideoxygalactose transaminase